MMAHIGTWLYFETEADYDQNIGACYYAGGAIEKPKTFPAYFCFCKNWDTHRFISYWSEANDKEKARKYFRRTVIAKIAEHKEEINSLENILRKA